jgi:hypothetical protein
VCWAPELGLFCAVASSGTGNRVMTSPDGIVWTVRASAADNSWYDLCWASELGLFCAVAFSGTGNRAMTSVQASGAASGVRRRGHPALQTIATDAAFTLTPMIDAPVVRHTGTLTASRTVSLSTVNAALGDQFMITRSGAGAFSLTVGTGPLKSLSTGTWCRVVFDGSAWALAEYGAL